MRLARRPVNGPSRFWAMLFRLRLARYAMPFWRVVVEVRPMRGRREWPREADVGVTGVFVWARSSEEAEGLAMLALEEERLGAVTADAKKADPAAQPRKHPAAVARTPLRYLARIREEPHAPPYQRGMRARE